MSKTSVTWNKRTLIIAEAGVNHNGSIKNAMRLVDAAKDAGADVVKFQIWKTEAIVSKDAEKAEYQKSARHDSESQYDLLKSLELSHSGFVKIRDYARKRKIAFAATPDDPESARFLVGLDVPFIKIGSAEVNNLPFLKFLAGLRHPIILSTGMSNLLEVRSAVRIIRRENTMPLAVLHCVSCYPARPDEANLLALKTLKKAFPHCTIGFSDHTEGIHVSVAAVALGARVIEKHFTLNRKMPGPDHASSLEPEDLKTMVVQIRDIEQALGTGEKVPQKRERETRHVTRRSLYVARDLREGEVIRADMLISKRPEGGISPNQLTYVIGKRLIKPLKTDVRLEYTHFAR